MESRRRELHVVGCLFLIHGLADISASVFRPLLPNPMYVDLLLSAFTRSQLCLLAIWLVIGKERLTWRISGLLSGSCFLFMVFSRAFFASYSEIGRESQWLDAEWTYYFRLWSPGDLLVKAPLLIGGVAAPLIVFRILRFMMRRRDEKKSAEISLRQLFRFRLQDVAIWTIAIAICLGAFSSAPYPDWFQKLFEKWLAVYDVHRDVDVYQVASAAIYVFATGGCLLLSYVKSRFKLCFTLFVVVCVGPTIGFDIWLQSLSLPANLEEELPSVWSESLTSILAATSIASSLFLVQIYETLLLQVSKSPYDASDTE